MGVAAALGTYAGEPYFARAMGFVEDDLRDKLRRLRINTRSLHKWVIAWAIAIVAVLFGFTIGFDSLPFGVVFAIMLICVPWYQVRRMAERRRRPCRAISEACPAASKTVRSCLRAASSFQVRSFSMMLRS